jgi:hypothetical protein
MAARPILGLVAGMLAFGLVTGPASAAVPADVQCNGVLQRADVHNVTVPSGGSCILRDSNVTGKVTALGASYFQAIHTRIAGDVAGNGAQTLFVEGGSVVGGGFRATRVAQVFLFSSRVTKHVKVDRTTDQVFICGSTVERGSITVSRSSRDILIGGSHSAGCGGNSVRRGSMSVLWNTTDVQLVVKGNSFPKGNLLVSGNGGPSEKIVQGNLGGTHIACQANAGYFRASKNRRWKSGGCRPS